MGLSRAAGALVATLVALALLAGCSGTATPGSPPVRAQGDAPAADPLADPLADPSVVAARNAVRSAVQAARQDAPLPSVTRPALGPDVEQSRADLGACGYAGLDVTGGELCRRGDPDAERTLVVLGDSHGRHWVPAIEQAAADREWATYYLVKQQCTGSLLPVGDPREAAPTEPWEACAEFKQWALDQIAELDPDLVVVSTSLPVNGAFVGAGFTREPGRIAPQYRIGFERLFAEIGERTDARVTLLADVPQRREGTEPLVCLREAVDQRACLSRRDSVAASISYTGASVRAANGAGVEVVDPSPLLCWQGTCPVVVDGVLPYRDRTHLTVEYSERLAEPIGVLLGM